MVEDSWETNIRLEVVKKSPSELRSYLIGETAARIIAVVADITNEEISDWTDAIHEDGPDGDHSLFVVEAELAGIMEDRPTMVDAFRDSIEWDVEVFSLDTHRAARALVNESLPLAESLWADRTVPKRTV
ncbi:hypothetical protein G6L37_02925 [Agrobacterium rubi]|nr:hypothetical protein [Agrobacterium rubi]NTF24331.1 hypothetical protein [Agrobacterium rubi]